MKREKPKVNNMCPSAKDNHSFPYTCFGIYSLSKDTIRQS